MNAMPWPETYLPPRKGAKHKTLHVTESVFWTKKEKIAHRLLSPHGWVVGRINSRKKNTGAWEGKYPGDGLFYQHKLKMEDYGIDKNWVNCVCFAPKSEVCWQHAEGLVLYSGFYQT